MTDDEPSLRPSNNAVSSKSLLTSTPMMTSAGQICASATVKQEIISDSPLGPSLSGNNYVNGVKGNGPDDQIKSEVKDIKCISNGISLLNTKAEPEANGHLDQQPCSSKEDTADDKDDGTKFRCPHTALFIDVAFPDLDKVSKEKLEELIIDDMSLILFTTLDDYKAFKVHEDSRRAKLETIRKMKEEEELARLAAIKREKLKSKHDAMKEKRRERNRQLKEQRAMGREERREQRERMRQQKWLSKEDRKRWREEYLQRKRERAERRQMKLKKLEERAKKEQHLQSTSLEAAGTASSSRNESGTTLNAQQSSIFSSPYLSKTPLHSGTCLPGPSSRPNPPYLMNDFPNQNVAMEALASLAGIGSVNQRMKRPLEESSPVAHNRTNGVIFSPSSKIPRLDSLSNSVTKVDPNEAARHLQNLSNGFFKSERLHNFENSLLGSLAPSTSTTNSHMPNLNPMFIPGTSKAAAQVANFLRNSQAPQFEMHQALMQNPELTFILTQAFATMNTAIDPIADGRTANAISSLMEHKPPTSSGLSHSAIPGMNQGSIAQNTAFSHMAMAAAAGVQPSAVNGSLLNAASQSVSTKLPVGNNSSTSLNPSTTGSNKLSTTNPSTSAGGQPKLSTTTPSIGIQFPKDASLGSQLAGAAVLGQKSFGRTSFGTAPLTPSQWCNKHVTIAQAISNKAKPDVKAAHQPANQPRNLTTNDSAKKPQTNFLQNSMPPPSAISQKPVQQQPPLPASNVLRPQLPHQPNQLGPNPLLNIHTQNLLMQNQLNPQAANMAPWQMLRFSQPGLNATPGITTGIPPQQHPPADLASQELAKFYRMNQQMKQEQAAPRPPSQQVERAASVATGHPNTNLPPSSAAAFSALLQNQNVNALLAGAGGQSNTAQQLNASFMNGQQNTDAVVRFLQMQMHQQQAMQAYNPVFQNGLLSQFPNLLGPSTSATMGMNPNSVRPSNMFNLFMDRDKQLNAALVAASQSNPVIAPPTTMAPRQTFPPTGASATNALQQFLQQNPQLSLSTANGLPQSAVTSAHGFSGFDLAGAQQLLALQQSRSQMISQPLMSNNTNTARNLLDMSQFAKLQFPQGGQKRE